MMGELHQARDAGLPQYRSALLSALARDLSSDPKVRGVFVSGSLAAGDEDLYSDIDLRIVVDRQDLKKFVEDKKQRAKRWGEVLFYEDLGPEVAHTVAHYVGFIKIDVFFYALDQMVPSLFHKTMRILHDPSEILTDRGVPG